MANCSNTNRLFSKDKLLSEYRKSIVNNEEKLVEAIKPTLAPFVLTRVITKQQEDEWKSRGDDARKMLVAFVLHKDLLEVYIKFSRCVQYIIKEYEAKKLFTFIPDLFEVGLHDPLPTTKGTTAPFLHQSAKL